MLVFITEIKIKIKFAAVDPDDKDYVTHGYMSMLPASMQVSKVNGSVVNTQKIYKVNGQGS